MNEGLDTGAVGQGVLRKATRGYSELSASIYCFRLFCVCCSVSRLNLALALALSAAEYQFQLRSAFGMRISWLVAAKCTERLDLVLVIFASTSTMLLKLKHWFSEYFAWAKQQRHELTMHMHLNYVRSTKRSAERALSFRQAQALALSGTTASSKA